MKAALITEEQIKKVEAALEMVLVSSECEEYFKALAIVKSLKVQEPVGFKQSHSNAISWHESGLFPIPVYAGEQP